MQTGFKRLNYKWMRGESGLPHPTANNRPPSLLWIPAPGWWWQLPSSHGHTEVCVSQVSVHRISAESKLDYQVPLWEWNSPWKRISQESTSLYFQSIMLHMPLVFKQRLISHIFYKEPCLQLWSRSSTLIKWLKLLVLEHGQSLCVRARVCVQA